jgi:hypothetical protein
MARYTPRPLQTRGGCQTGAGGNRSSEIVEQQLFQIRTGSSGSHEADIWGFLGCWVMVVVVILLYIPDGSGRVGASV